MEAQVKTEAKTNGHAAVAEAVPGIILRISAQVGHSRSMEVQFACPLDMTPKDLNRYIDKVTAVLNRQNDIGLLAVARANLSHARKEVLTNQENRANYESKCRLEYSVSGRRGDFRATESQNAQLRNWDTNIQNLRENLIPKFEKEISDLERQIDEGV